jgi:hypothetical protein
MTEAKARAGRARATGDDQTSPPATEPRAANVVEALLRVMRDLPPIEKMMAAEHKKRHGQTANQAGDSGVNFAYRSIDQVAGGAHALCAKHGVLPVPRVLGEPRITNFDQPRDRGGVTRWTDVIEQVVFDCYGPGGLDDKLMLGPVWVMGRDNADKAFNKALTQAFKQTLQVTLVIGGDPADEGEHEKPELGGEAQPPVKGGGRDPDEDQRPWHERWGYTDGDEVLTVNEPLGKLLDLVPDDRRANVRAWLTRAGYPAVAQGGKPYWLPVRKTQAKTYEVLLRSLIPAGTAPPPAGPAPGDDQTEPHQGTMADAAAATALPLTGLVPEWVPEDVRVDTLELVRTMPTDEVDTELRALNLPKSGRVDQRRNRLVVAMVRKWAVDHAQDTDLEAEAQAGSEGLAAAAGGDSQPLEDTSAAGPSEPGIPPAELDPVGPEHIDPGEGT